jgi:hypothetical protein
MEENSSFLDSDDVFLFETKEKAWLWFGKVYIYQYIFYNFALIMYLFSEVFKIKNVYLV